MHVMQILAHCKGNSVPSIITRSAITGTFSKFEKHFDSDNSVTELYFMPTKHELAQFVRATNTNS